MLGRAPTHRPGLRGGVIRLSALLLAVAGEAWVLGSGSSQRGLGCAVESIDSEHGSISGCRRMTSVAYSATSCAVENNAPGIGRTSRGHCDGLVKSSAVRMSSTVNAADADVPAQSTRRMARSKLVTCSRASEAAASPSPAAMASSSERMLADMLGQVGQPVDDQAPDPGGEIVVADEDVLEMRVAGGSVDELVDGHVFVDEGGSIAGDHLEVLGSGPQSPSSRLACRARRSRRLGGRRAVPGAVGCRRWRRVR